MLLKDLKVGESTTIDPDGVTMYRDGKHWVNGTQTSGRGGFRVTRTASGLRAERPKGGRKIGKTSDDLPPVSQDLLQLTFA